MHLLHTVTHKLLEYLKSKPASLHFKSWLLPILCEQKYGLQLLVAQYYFLMQLVHAAGSSPLFNPQNSRSNKISQLSSTRERKMKANRPNSRNSPSTQAIYLSTHRFAYTLASRFFSSSSLLLPSFFFLLGHVHS
jgi:hypothetical protein